MTGDFREAMSRFPSGVTIVTTVDALGRHWGLTASAFTSVSADPRMVLVCVDQRADSHEALAASERFAISILASHHEEVARRFATKGADKFGSAGFAVGSLGLPVVMDALVVLECRTAGRLPAGDHTVLLGEVNAVRLGTEAAPMVYYGRNFRELDPNRPRRPAPSLAFALPDWP
jgi:flavin reductase ActVB